MWSFFAEVFLYAWKYCLRASSMQLKVKYDFLNNSDA